MPSHPAPLAGSTRAWLLHHARRSIAAYLEGAQAPSNDACPQDGQRPSGCFVTLHTRAGMLRGCIGTFDEQSPLCQNVQDMAISAASRDPRFAPLTARELADCTLEISALTPRKPAQPQEVTVGEHGLWVTRGTKRGVLLPQVATERAWDRETFLDQTCIKADMPPDAWRDGSVELYVFTAEVFSEHG